MEMWQIASGIVIAIVTGIATNATGKTQANAEIETEKVKTRSEEWTALLSEVRGHSEERFKDYEERLESLEDRFAMLGEKYGTSLEHIVFLRRLYPLGSELPMIPEEIVRDLFWVQGMLNDNDNDNDDDNNNKDDNDD